MQETSVYVLLDPRDRRVRYVGISKHPHVRLYAHSLVNLGGCFTTAKRLWRKALAELGLQPAMEVVFSAPRCAALAEEARLIHHYAREYARQGCSGSLTDLTNGARYLPRGMRYHPLGVHERAFDGLGWVECERMIIEAELAIQPADAWGMRAF
jgi:hypothetical protein